MLSCPDWGKKRLGNPEFQKFRKFHFQGPIYTLGLGGGGGGIDDHDLTEILYQSQ